MYLTKDIYKLKYYLKPRHFFFKAFSVTTQQDWRVLVFFLVTRSKWMPFSKFSLPSHICYLGRLEEFIFFFFDSSSMTLVHFTQACSSLHFTMLASSPDARQLNVRDRANSVLKLNGRISALQVEHSSLISAIGSLVAGSGKDLSLLKTLQSCGQSE